MYKQIILVAVVLVASAAAEFKSDAFICRNGTLAPGKALGEKLEACKDPSVVKDTDMKCIGHCISDAFGATKDGAPNRAIVSQIIKTQFPVAEQAGAETRIQKCFDDLGADYDKAKDTDCSKIYKYSNCGVAVVVQTPC